MNEIFESGQDKWVHSHHTHKIQAPVRILNAEATVNELIDQTQNWWNVPLLEQIFPSEIAELICNMAICPQLQRDRLTWEGTTTGSFTVPNAYHLEVDRRERFQGSGSSSSGAELVWSSIWQLQVPRAVQLFIRRACKDILPTKDRLLKRRVVDDPGCPN